MALLPIICYPDPRLHKVAKPVKLFDDRLKKIVSDMAQTMYEAPGVGLAATQVDIHERIIVIDTSDSREELKVFINPEIVWQSEEHKVWREGCLSVPDYFDEVDRPNKVRVKAFDENGEVFELEAEGLLSVCIQHEMDHLIGKVFVDYLSPLKRMRIKGKMKKREKLNAN
jgi:peptide deformylase